MLVLAYLGLTLMVGAWLRLGHVLSHRTVSVREMAMTLVWWSAPLLAAAPLYSRDVYSYLAQGAMFVEGIDPYRFGPAALGGELASQVSPIWQHTAAPYGPTFLLLAGAIMAVVGEHVVLGILGMRVLAISAMAVFVWAVPIIARRCGIEPGRALWLGVLNPLVIVHVVSGAHNDALMVALMLIAVVLLLRRRPLLAAVVVGLATLVKAPAILALAFIVAAVWGPRALQARPLMILVAKVGAAGLGTMVVLTLVTRTGFGWVTAMGNTAEVRNGLSISTDLGIVIDVLLRLLGLNQPVDVVGVMRIVGLMAAAAVTAYLLLRHRDRPLLGLAISLTAVVVLGPVVNPWYLLWGLVLLGATTAHRQIVRLATVVSVFLVFYPMPSGGAPTAEFAVGMLGIAAGVLFLWGYPGSTDSGQQSDPVVSELDGDQRDHDHEPQDDRDYVDARQGANHA